MSDFKFQEWERLSEKVTDGEADLRCVVEETEWLFRQCGEWWFAREAASVGCEGNWLFRPILAVSTSGDYSFPCAQMPREEMGRWLRNVGPDELREAYFRVWESPEEGNAAPFGAAWNRWDGWVYGIDLACLGDHRPCFPFRLETPIPAEQMDSSSLFSLLQNEWQNEDSELRFCARFADLDEESRDLWKVQTRIGEPSQMARLLRCALQSFGFLWDEKFSEIGMFLVVGRDGVFAWNEVVNQKSDAASFERALPIRERVLLKQIVRAFEPRARSDSSNLPRCVQRRRQPMSRKFVHPGMVVEICAARPTQHERLEAALELRSWLETHWPDGVKHLGKVV